MISTALQAFMDAPIDWEAFEEVTLALLPDRGEVIEILRHIHGPKEVSAEEGPESSGAGYVHFPAPQWMKGP
jgi:hypothetical protein